jgi:hypothetical protein
MRFVFLVESVGSQHPNIRVLQPESVVDIAGDPLVRLDNVLQFDVDEVVKRVNMLFDQALDFEECRQQVPLVLRRVYLVRDVFAVVEWFEQRVEGVVVPARFLLCREQCRRRDLNLGLDALGDDFRR